MIASFFVYLTNIYRVSAYDRHHARPSEKQIREVQFLPSLNLHSLSVYLVPQRFWTLCAGDIFRGCNCFPFLSQKWRLQKPVAFSRLHSQLWAQAMQQGPSILSENDQSPESQRQPISMIISFKAKVINYAALHIGKNIRPAIRIWICVPLYYFLMH